MLEAIAEQRIKAYHSVWELTKELQYAQEEEISKSEKKELRNKLSSWYYKDGAAMFLSHNAFTAYAKARKTIKEDSKPYFRVLQNAFSALRTELKNNLKIYVEEEKNKPTMNPDKDL